VRSATVHVIMPALNEERAIAGVIRAISAQGFGRIIVADNGSTDRTPELAQAEGALVVREERRGYGAACLAGIAALEAGNDDIVAFIDADGSDDPADLHAVVTPLLQDRADFVIGSRTLGRREQGALAPHARFGNALATTLIRMRTGACYTDLGPLRALRFGTLADLAMRDADYGWTVEMQLKAATKRLRIREVPVRYRKRIGQSKISGTLLGSVRAGVKILTTIIRHGS
jgi:glycosyltransferase involved in cell wall biosynthesis